MKLTKKILTLTILLSCLGGLYGQVYISEIMADNETVLADGAGDYEDWIELRNTSNTSINLGGWYLTDDTNDLTKWTFPTVTIGANSRIVVWASGKYPTSLNNGLHTDFSLESKGEYLALVMPDGNTIANDFTYPALPEDVSYGIFSGSDNDYTNGGNFVALATPTPGSANTNALEAPVEFSVDGRFFENSLTVTLSTTVPGGTIHYTTNGNTPTTSSPVYNSPISISATTQLNAIVAYSGGGSSPVKIERYVLMSAGVASANSDLPIILINSYNNNIGETNQTKTFVSIIEPDATGRAQSTDTPTYSGPMGLKIRGSSSANFAKKQYKVETWNEDNEEINVEILGMPAESDWVLYAPGTSDPAMINNPLMYELSRKMGFYAPRIRFVEVYINEGSNMTTSDYRGLYIWMESIKRDNDRIDIKKLEPTDNNFPEITGGYMISIDRPGEWQTGRDFPPPASYDVGLNHVEPKINQLTSNQRNYIRNYIQDFENALYSNSWLDPNSGYKNYIDLHSWTWEHMMRILAKDPDALRLSSYYYKDRDSLLKAGPIWDFDRTLDSDDGRDDNPNEWFFNQNNDRVDYFEYGWWARMTEDPDWRVQWHDNWFGQRRDGCLKTSVVLNLADSLAAIIQEAQARDETRWAGTDGYGYGSGGFSGRVQGLKNWINSRMNWIDDRLVPNPGFSPAQGIVPFGTSVSLNNPYGSGVIYYTTNGTDPRLPGGGFSPSAVPYTGPIAITGPTQISARIYVNGRWGNQIQSPWGAICTQRYQLPQNYSGIVINEIMYHPGTACGAFIPELDYIEILNKGNTTVDMSFVKFTNGIDYTFPFGSSLAPNQFYVIAEDKLIFDANYGTTADAQYKGTLSNKGDSLVLKNVQNSIIDIVDFNDKKPWDEAPDGDSPALELLDPSLDNNDPLSWFRSDNSCGTPGAANSRLCASAATPIVINEINYNAPNSPNPGDWIELYNPNASAVNISNWEFYDGKSQFIIPSGTTIQPDEYLILTEDAAAFGTLFPHLNANQYIGDWGFSLDNGGERISLFDPNKCISDYVTYDDDMPWDTIPDGNGPTLSLINPYNGLDNSLNTSWQSSSDINSAYGTPGRENTPCFDSNVILPNLICAGLPVEIKVDSAYSDMDFTWFVPGATPSNFTVDSDTIVWNNPGTYNLQLITKYQECTKVYNQQITVEDCNTMPNIIDDNYAINEDNILPGNVLNNDSDPDNDNLTANTTPLNNVTNGTLVLNPNGTFAYTPNPDFYGTDSFTYEVCDDATFTTIVTTPGSFSGQVISSADDVEELTNGTIETTSGDLDMMEDSPDFYAAIGIRMRNISVPQGATVTGAYLEFVADEAQSLATSFTISAEATGNAAPIPTTANALTSKNKTIANASWANLPAWTIGNTYQSPDISNVVQEIINRGDWAGGNAMTFIITGTGQRTAESFDGGLPPKLIINYETSGVSVPIDVSLCNTATVNITVNPVNDAPQAVNDILNIQEDSPATGNALTNDVNVDGDNLTVNITPITPPQNGSLALLASGFYSYTPNPDFFGSDTFEYEMCDDGNPVLCDIASVTIDVAPINDAPVTAPDTLSVFADASIQDNVLLNDSDIENDGLTATTTPIIAPSNGTLIIQPNGNIDYTPNPGFIGTDSFDYEVCDDGTPSQCNTETVIILIESDCVDVELYAWLEGAFDPALGEMSTTLVSTRKLLPGQTPTSNLATPTPAGQPYSIAPWNYAGTEGASWTNADYTGDETDWVLVSFRTDIPKSTEVGIAAGLLMKDGSITFPDRCALTSVASPLYIVVEHRNHIGIMTPQPVDVIGGMLTYDFRLAESYRDPTSFGQKQLSTGEWTMYAGDADQSDFPSYDIQGTDKTIWFDNNGVFDYYLSPDFNLDGDVNGQDKSLWFDNNGISSRVPK